MPEKKDQPEVQDRGDFGFIKDGKFDTEAFYNFEREIEMNMEPYDIANKLREADAVKELGKLIITA